MKILVGVDDSKYSGDILRAIVSERRADNTEVLVLHVLQPVGPAPPQMHQGYAPELEAEREAAKTLVERIATELRSAGRGRRCPGGHHRYRRRLACRSDHGRLARAQRHAAVSAGQRVGVRRPPRPLFRGDRAHAGESLNPRSVLLGQAGRSSWRRVQLFFRHRARRSFRVLVLQVRIHLSGFVGLAFGGV